VTLKGIQKFKHSLSWAAAVLTISSIPVGAVAQNNAVCTTQTGCTTTAQSSAFIDASVASVRKSDLCFTIFSILSPPGYPPEGAVIDARGLPAQNVNMTCAAGTSPWFNTSFVNKPSTILLPAGTITIPASWVLPSGTKIIGEGVSSTVLLAGKKLSGPMIQFGSNCPGNQCTGIVTGVSVEDLTLNGAGNLNVSGIQNKFGQDTTYVNHVQLYQILGTGLQILGSANNSGPYSNITFDTGAYSPSGTTACANILGLTGTKGLHGITCIGRTNNGQVAIYLDSPNNSLEDVRIMGFNDGILVGSQQAVQGNALFNVLGDTSALTGLVINVIHVSNANSVSDLSVMGVSNQGIGATTIRDDLTSTPLSDPNIAMYVLGKSTAAGYSRFTTSPNAANWAFGTNDPPTGACIPGSLYSNTNTGTGGGALYACAYGSTNIWKKVVLH
jgi:hypothetical protein